MEHCVARVLLVDDEEAAVARYGWFLRLAGHDLVTVRTGRDGIRASGEFRPDVAVIDLRLPDMSGLEVLRELRARRPETPCVLLSASWNYEVEFDAIGLGACACMRKPDAGDEVLELIERALVTRPPEPAAGAGGIRRLNLEPIEAHGCTRLADTVVAFIASAADAPTLTGFGRAVGMSVGAFRNWCYGAGLTPNRVLLFARGLRATVRQHERPLRPCDLLKIVDRRTLAKFLVRCGRGHDRLPASAGEFLERQQFVDKAEFVEAVRAALSDIELANAASVPGRRTLASCTPSLSAHDASDDPTH
jgi:CheY-like chemotaxis protein